MDLTPNAAEPEAAASEPPSGGAAELPASPLDVAALFDEYGERVLGFAYRMLGDVAEAQDATQEAFLKAHRSAPGFGGGCAPATWLFAIARNTCLDRLRVRGRRTFASLESVVTEACQPAAVRADDAALLAERHWYVEAVREGCLLATLACLSVEQRSAFVLRVLCGMSTADTAVVLERSENAVRVLTSRARGRLKAFLCRNCSIYQPGNRCDCQNLVAFSLSRGWIGPGDRKVSRRQAAAAAARAAAGISEVARLAAVYSSLEQPRLAPSLALQIRTSVGALGSRQATVTTRER